MPLDFFDNRLNFRRKLGEQQANARGFKSVRTTGVADAYRKGNLALVFHVKARRIDGECCEFSAVYNAVRRRDGNRLYATASGGFDVGVSACQMNSSECEEPVFVSVIEVPEKGEKRRERAVRSVVRLYLLDLCPHCRVEGLNPPHLLREVGGSVRNGELKDFLAGRRVGSGLNGGDGVNQMVKGRPKIVNTVAEEEGQSVEVGWLGDAGDKMVLMAVRAMINRYGGWLRMTPSSNFSVGGFGVFYCTPDLQPIARFAHGEAMILHFG